MRLSSCIGSWLKWLHKAGGLWERWCRDSIFLLAHNRTVIMQCEHISPSSAHVSISAFVWFSGVLCISHLMSLDTLIRMAFFTQLTMTTLTLFADVFWRTRCLKWETTKMTPEGNQWVCGRRRWKEWHNNQKKKKRKGDRIKTKEFRKKEKVWMETGEEMGE